MADTKISALSAGTAAPGDEIPVNRGGSNFKITAGDILKINGGTITANSPVLDLTQTWNNAAVTFTGLKFNPTDTASGASSLLMDLQVGGGSKFKVAKDGTTTVAGGMFVQGVSGQNVVSIGAFDGVVTGSSGYLGFGPSRGTTGSDADVRLTRDAADTLAQRRTTNAQTFRIYNTFTDASNYERGKISWESNILRIGTERAGTGTARALELQTDGTTRVLIDATGTFDVLNRELLVTTSAVMVGSSNAFGFTSTDSGNVLDAVIKRAGTGILTLGNASTITDFSRLQFGGTTSSFPALKRNSAALNVRLADDSADAAFTASTLTASSSAANTSAIASTGYSLTGSSAVSMVDLAGTWNTTGTPTAIKLNVTDTASNAASLLMDLGTGGGSFVSKFSVTKDGAVTMNGNLTISTKDIVTDTTTGTKIGTATSQKLGFFNAAPVVQQNGTGETTGFTAGSGTAVNDDSTFTGNVGATAYRVNDIVKALKNLGLLAQ